MSQFNQVYFDQAYFNRNQMANRKPKLALLSSKRVKLYDTQVNLGAAGVFSTPLAASVDGGVVSDADWLDVSDFATVQLEFAADVAGASLNVLSSPDPSDNAWTETEYAAGVISADAQTDQIITPKFRYLRLVETNGAGAQTGKTLTLWGLK